MNIFVGKLSWGTTSETLRSVFEAYGEVSFAKVITDRETNRSRGFGFVEMADDEAGRNAIAALDNTDVDGRTIAVKEAEPREQRAPGGFTPRPPRTGGAPGGFRSGGGDNRDRRPDSDRAPRRRFDSDDEY